METEEKAARSPGLSHPFQCQRCSASSEGEFEAVEHLGVTHGAVAEVAPTEVAAVFISVLCIKVGEEETGGKRRGGSYLKPVPLLKLSGRVSATEHAAKCGLRLDGDVDLEVFTTSVRGRSVATELHFVCQEEQKVDEVSREKSANSSGETSTEAVGELGHDKELNEEDSKVLCT